MKQQTNVEHRLEAARQHLNTLLECAWKLPPLESTLLDEALEQLTRSLEVLRADRGRLTRRDVALGPVRQILAHERQRCRELFDLAPDACLITTPTAKIKEANRAASYLLGFNQVPLIGKPLLMLVAPGLRRQFRELLCELKDREGTLSCEMEMQRPDRTTFPAEMEVTYERLSGGRESLKWVIRDITGLKRAQEAVAGAREVSEGQALECQTLQAAYQVLRREVAEHKRVSAEQQKFLRLVESSCDFIALADQRGRVSFLNTAGRKLLGLRRTVRVPDLRLSSYWTKETWTRVRELGLPAVRERSRWQGEGQLRRSDGKLIEVEIDLWTAQAPASSERSWLCVGQRDVTERKRVERMNAEWVSTISRELWAPLPSIVCALERLAEGAASGLPADLREVVEMAYRNSNGLVRLLDNLQDIEKLESGKVDLDLRPVYVVPLMEEMLHACRPFTDRFDISFKWQQSVKDAKVLADRRGFAQVLTHLLSKAAKSSPSGSTVSVGLKRLRGRVRVAVADQGSGIPEEIQPRVFEKFVQGAGSCQKEGTGLESSIVKALVEKMGGEIGFKTKPDKGTTFYFDLPEPYEESAIE